MQKSSCFHIPPTRSVTGLLLLQLDDAKEIWIVFQKQALQSSEHKVIKQISTLSSFSELQQKKKKQKAKTQQ